MKSRIFLCGVALGLAALSAGAYGKPDYRGLDWKDAEKRVIKGPKSYAAFVSTIPKRNDLLKASFDDSSITMDTRDFYALPDQKKEVMLYLPGIRKEDGVRLKPGEVKGEVWNCYRIRIKGPAGGQVALIFEGRRAKKFNNGHFRVDKVFILDGTEQTLVHKLELPADLESFGLRLDLKTPGVFRFEAPDFYTEKKEEKSSADPDFNYIRNGGAENGFDNTMYLPLKRRAHAAHGAFINWKGERETFQYDLERDSANARSGKYAYRIRFSGDGPMTSRVDSFAFHPVPLLPGEEYTYTVWAKAERPAGIEMGLYLGNGAGLSRVCPVGTEWTKLELHVPAWGAGDSVRNGKPLVNSYHAPAGVLIPTFVAPANNTVWFDDACVRIGARGEVPEKRTVFFRSATLDKPNHYYFPGEAVGVALTLESTGKEAVEGAFSWELFDFYGNSAAGQTLKQLRLMPNQESREQFRLVPPENLRGPMNLVCTFDAGKMGRFKQVFYLGVVDRPQGLNRRFSMEVPASQNILDVIPFLLDFGIGAVRCGGASGRMSLALENAPFLHKAGIEILLNYSADKKTEKGDEAALREFCKKFRADMMKHHDILTVVESHNEANLGVVNVAWNARIIREMRKILDEVAPKLKLAGPDPCGTDFAWIQGVLAAGAAKELDIVSEHPYRKMPELPDYGDDVAAVRKIIDLYKPGTPHYATESGRVQPPVLPDNTLFDYVRIASARDLRNMLLGFGNGLAQYNQFAISSWQIGVGWNALFMGNKENDGAQLPSPILFAMRNAADRLGTGKAAGRIKLGYNYRAFLFDKGDSRTAVFWKFNGGDAKFRLKAEDAEKVRLYDMVGSRWNPKEPFPVGEFPVYLESTLSAPELEAVIRRAEIREDAGKTLKAEAQVVAPRVFHVNLRNLGTKKLSGIRVRVEDRSLIDGPVEQTVDALNPEELRSVSFRLREPVSTSARKVALSILAKDGKPERITLNLAAITVPKTAKALTIDGDLSDWPAGTQVVLDQHNAVVREKALWGEKERKIRSELRYAWDDNFFYTGVTVYKEKLNSNPDASKPGDVWQYDSFQLCLDPLHNGKPEDLAFSDDDFEYSLGVVAGKPVVFRRTGSSAVYDSLMKAPGIVPEVRFAVRTEPGKTVYEAAFPRQAVSPFLLRTGSLMRSSIIVNLREEGKRIGYLELTPGVGDVKSPGKWMDTVLVPQEQEF